MAVVADSNRCRYTHINISRDRSVDVGHCKWLMTLFSFPKRPSNRCVMRRCALLVNFRHILYLVCSTFAHKFDFVFRRINEFNVRYTHIWLPPKPINSLNVLSMEKLDGKQKRNESNDETSPSRWINDFFCSNACALLYVVRLMESQVVDACFVVFKWILDPKTMNTIYRFATHFHTRVSGSVDFWCWCFFWAEIQLHD